MAKKIYIALQTPTVIIPIQSEKDCTGARKKLKAEFKRYRGEESDRKLTEFRNIVDRKPPVELLGENITEDQQKELLDFQFQVVRDIKTFIKHEIVSLQDVPLIYEDESGRLTERVFNDTKKAEKDDELWGAPENCLDFLLDIILDSAPWSSPFITAMYSVFNNVQIGQAAEVKN